MKIKYNDKTKQWEVIDMWFGVIEAFVTKGEALRYKRYIS